MITIEQLQENLIKLIKSEDCVPMTLEEIWSLLTDERLTSKQLKRVLLIVAFRDVYMRDGSVKHMVNAIRARNDFESLIEDFEFSTYYIQSIGAINGIDRMA